MATKTNKQTNFKLSRSWKIGIIASLLILATVGISFLLFQNNREQKNEAKAASFTSTVNQVLDANFIQNGSCNPSSQNIGTPFTTCTFPLDNGQYTNIGSCGNIPATNPTNGITYIPSGNGVLILGNNLGNTILGTNVGSPSTSGSGIPTNYYSASGNDTIYGYAGDDVIFGQYGNDYIDGGLANDCIDGGDNGTTPSTSGLKDTLLGGAGDDILNGGAGDDTLIAGANSDISIGGSGNDLLYSTQNISASNESDIYIGVDPKSAAPGFNEIDTLGLGQYYGGTTYIIGSGKYWLGDGFKSYYNNDGNNGYAMIRGWTSTYFGQLQLFGALAYTAGTANVPVPEDDGNGNIITTNKTLPAIYLDKDNSGSQSAGDDLLAVFETYTNPSYQPVNVNNLLAAANRVTGATPLVTDPGYSSNTVTYNYSLPAGGIQAAISQNGNGVSDLQPVSGGYSGNCELIDNTSLRCTNVPTTGGTGGLRNLLLKINNTLPVDKGDATLLGSAITGSDITLSCVPASPVNPNTLVTCTATYPPIKTGTINWSDTFPGISGANCPIHNVNIAGGSATCTGTPTVGGSYTATANASGGGNQSQNVLVNTLITAANVQDCLTQTITINDLYTCNFPLTGAAPGTNYILPSGGIVGRTLQGVTTTPNSDNCTVSGSTLICANLKTATLVAGLADVTLQFNNTGGYVDKGNVNLVVGTTPITGANISLVCLPANPVSPNTQVTCTASYPPNKTGSIFWSDSFSLISGANCSIHNVNVQGGSTTCIATPTAGGTYIATANASGGGFATQNVLVQTIVGAANLQNPTCVPNQLIVESVQVTDCTFPLVGGGNYVLPSGSTIGKLLGPSSQLGNNGSNCAINVANTALVCTNIPATSLSSSSLLPKGPVNVKVTFPSGPDFNSTNTPVTLIGRKLNYNDLGNCNVVNPVTLGNTFDCLFPIIGPISQIDTVGVSNPDLSNAVRAGIGQPQSSGIGTWLSSSPLSSNSNICSVVGSNLSCQGISTTTASGSFQNLAPGPADVILAGGNFSPLALDKGDVILTRPATGTELDNAISCTPDATLVNTTVTCTGKLPPYITVENLTVKVTTSGTPATCSTSGSLANGLDIACLPANVGSNPGVLDILASTTGPGAVTNVRVDDVTVTNSVSEVLLIEADKVLFNPTKAAPQTFGKTDLVMTVKNDSRFTSNGVNNNLTAVCRFKLKVFGANNSDTTNGYPITQTRLTTTSTNAQGQTVSIGQGGFDQATQSYQVPYDSNTGCSVKIPTAQQNQPKWEFDIRVERSDGQVFGSPEAYFMLYGAIGQVSIGAS